MEMNNFPGESHVAQQSRRDKLRVQHQNSEHLEDHYNNLEQYPDLLQLRNLKYGTTPYDPTVFSSDMSYVTKKNSLVLLPQNNQSLVSADKFSVVNLSHPISSNHNISAAKLSGDPHNCSNWKSIGSQQNYDWVVNNYSSNSTSIHENNVNNTLFVGGEGDVSGSLKVNSISSPSFYMKQPNSFGYQDVVESSLVANPSGESSIIHQNSQRNFGGMQHCSGSSQFDYQNTLQEVVTTATVGAHGEDMAGYGGKDSNELLLLSSFGDTQSAHVRVCNNSVNWVNRPVEDFRTVKDLRMIADSSNVQGLSLSLSSVPLSNTREGQFGERNYSSDPLDSKALRSDYLCSSSRTSIGSKVFGNTLQNIVGTSTIPHRNAVGPLGPFTGYATILKNSKFLKPTLQLLDELCGITGPNQVESHEVYSNKISEEAGVSSDHTVNATESVVGAKGGESGVSSSTFYSSNEISEEAGGRTNESYRPEYHQKKAKLLYMQEEVCRRYKQYHQQMQMVVSSFESVAGLSAATPYISMALKTVSRHFRCLKHAITDQLRHMGKALGGDLSSPTAGMSSSTKGDASTSRLKFIDHSFQKQKSGGSNLVFFEPQQPVWRPQRGLPERAVAVLRAWLFDHFLHPYPTDTDKHMLASQTGLTRNQVSNWFINARVRVWKPMVEEIHVLETKGSTEPSSQTGKADGNPASENASHQYDNQPTSKLSGFDPSTSRDGPSAELWNQDKRSRVECQIPSSMDGTLMSFLPYQRGGLEIGAGLGAVSLTLGLRQSVESAQQQQQQQQQQQLQQQEHYRQHFGGQMIHDFVG